MPYQQAVQWPKRPVGRGVVADTPAGKTAPMGGTMQDHGRPAARGWGHGSCSVSHPRGVPEMAGVQPQCQEGGLPSGLMPTTSSTSARENPASVGRLDKVRPLGSCEVGGKLSQQWVEEGPRTHFEGLLQV